MRPLLATEHRDIGGAFFDLWIPTGGLPHAQILLTGFRPVCATKSARGVDLNSCLCPLLQSYPQQDLPLTSVTAKRRHCDDKTIQALGCAHLDVLRTPYAPFVQAATVNDSLGVPAVSVDFFAIDCPAGTHHLSDHITDIAPVRAPDLTLTTIKGVSKDETTDPIDGLQAQAIHPYRPDSQSS